jgi:hypothetical protein
MKTQHPLYKEAWEWSDQIKSELRGAGVKPLDVANGILLLSFDRIQLSRETLILDLIAERAAENARQGRLDVAEPLNALLRYLFDSLGTPESVQEKIRELYAARMNKKGKKKWPKRKTTKKTGRSSGASKKR